MPATLHYSPTAPKARSGPGLEMLGHKAAPSRSLVSSQHGARPMGLTAGGTKHGHDRRGARDGHRGCTVWCFACLTPYRAHTSTTGLRRPHSTLLAALLGALKAKHIQLLALTLCLVLLAAPRLPVLGRKQRGPGLLLWPDTALTRGSSTGIKRAAGLQPPPGFHLLGLGGPGWQPPAF